MIRKPVLTNKHTEKCLQWAKDNRQTDWNHILFTDESSLEVGGTDRQVRVSRQSGEAYIPRNMTSTFRSGRQSLMVWAGIAYNFKTALFQIPLAPSRVERSARIRAEGLNAQRYADLVIKGPLQAAWHELTTFLDGYQVVEHNAPCHNGLAARQVSLNELFMVARKVWDKIEIEIINGCVESMPRRVSNLAAIKGKSLKY
ncbi:hypothetical protein IE53DRAFT_366502 [Violaceomyces palustris]|uniref:Uncharacterized protein n=1 Tax=Violaceomyces palustris TaxID=1673888 RepID=A0ACD0P5E7_9BASI|nr:hypothetical protein IE53DRAFT_366502 [Violaceomyces palustris]